MLALGWRTVAVPATHSACERTCRVPAHALGAVAQHRQEAWQHGRRADWLRLVIGGLAWEEVRANPLLQGLIAIPVEAMPTELEPKTPRDRLTPFLPRGLRAARPRPSGPSGGRRARPPCPQRA